MELKDLNKTIVELATRAITVREVMDFMREKEEKQAYGEWSIRWTVFSDVLSLLTGRGIVDCLTVTNFKDIIKEYSVE